jgi:hypothetical protein
MTVLRIVVLISLAALTARSQQNSPQPPPIQPESLPPATCPVTVPPAQPFTPPRQYELDDNSKAFWFGTEKLWVGLEKSGTLDWAPHPPGHEHEVQPLTEKTFWGSVDFNWRTEWPVTLKVTGRRLDWPAPPLLTLRATNAFPGPAAAMLVGIYVPAPGCWEITGDYKGQKLSYVIWVRPRKKGNE